MSSVNPVMTFWGCRGCCNVTGGDKFSFGYNTPCITIEQGDHCLILDSGSGIRDYAIHLIKNKSPLSKFNLLLSHYHNDHISGFPLFYKLYTSGNTVNVFGPLLESTGCAEILTEVMKRDCRHQKSASVKADLNFHDFNVGQNLEFDGFKVSSIMLNHPGNSVGYSIKVKSFKIVYFTDTEMENKVMDDDQEITVISAQGNESKGYSDKLIEMAYGADILIFDSQYSDEEQKKFIGNGHSTFTEALFVAAHANVKKLYFFHHDPFHSNSFLLKQLEQLKEEFSYYFEKFEVYLAKEGETVQLNS